MRPPSEIDDDADDDEHQEPDAHQVGADEPADHEKDSELAEDLQHHPDRADRAGRVARHEGFAVVKAAS